MTGKLWDLCQGNAPYTAEDSENYRDFWDKTGLADLDPGQVAITSPSPTGKQKLLTCAFRRSGVKGPDGKTIRRLCVLG